MGTMANTDVCRYRDVVQWQGSSTIYLHTDSIPIFIISYYPALHYALFTSPNWSHLFHSITSWDTNSYKIDFKNIIRY